MKTTLLILLFTACLSSCSSAQPSSNVSESSTSKDQESENESSEGEIEMKLKLAINDYEFDVTLEENDATQELVEMARNEPITIRFEDYGGFEKVGPLGRSLTTDNSRITTKPGDIVVYQGNQIVMFYGTNTWSYTMLGHVDDLTNWEAALSPDEVTAVFSLR